MWYGKSENNYVEVLGICSDQFTYSHRSRQERFFKTCILVEEKGRAGEQIPLIVPEYLLDRSVDYNGQFIEVQGQFRSHDLQDPDRNRMLLNVYAKFLFLCPEKADPLNDISLRGMIWKRPVLRETPAGKEMAQFIAAVNRPAGKTDYIPCVCWGENARYAAELPGGSHVRITGRIQSRDYFKKEEAVRVVLNTVCEVYVRSIKAW